ncbi:toluene transport protein [Sulfurihydrogenibium azorense Az-Fu1]|uniref:Toluene transport protein n=1 Tax=Sulfurihydrogenibium azorense (strain DSM 15241 / OCM 825 / Az-Fu1) TaxID=204536 RepID=C1DUB9_SULAA|nr:outer membrane protein transport protein [Sulfurihydrogenibium azorense]ACN98671.1 toluene transport protein [Sulfurihydrogenibium azorense Az-Fu1]
MRKVLASAAILAVAGSAMATNGDNMIGVTPASQAMGGIGVGMPIGSVDSIFRNPAWMNSEKGFAVSFGGILFMPSVKARYNGSTNGDTGYVSSRANFFTVPEIGITNRINDQVVVGIAAYGVSGMGVDYRNKDPRLANMHTTLQFMRIIPAVSYQVNPNLSVGVGLNLAWGSLDMGANAGGGQSSSYGVGAQLGIGYKVGDLTVGFNYQSPVSMKYKHVFDSNGDGSYEDLKLQQPQEVAAGIGYRVLPNLKVGLDLRWINWSDADGYKQFKWKDQTVIAVGGEYQVNQALKLRAGYNYGKSPIRSYSGLNGMMPTNNIPSLAQPFPDFNVQWFNLIGFPAITEHHISFGGSYQFTKNFAVDLAYVHAFEKKVESSGQNALMGDANATVGAKNAQNEVGIALRWSF